MVNYVMETNLNFSIISIQYFIISDKAYIVYDKKSPKFFYSFLINVVGFKIKYQNLKWNR